MSRIEILTPAQEARIPEFRDAWRSVVTTPINRERATAIVGQLYKRMGHEPPRVMFLDSPLAMYLAYGMLQPTLGALFDRTGPNLRDQLRDQLWDQLRDQLWGQLGGQLGDQLRGQLWGQLRGQLYQTERPEWAVAWSAWFDFSRYIGVNLDPQKYDLFTSFARECGWVLPYQGICFMSDRPRTVRWNAEGRLHNPDGPAVEFADGYGLWAYDGVRLPEQYQKPVSEWESGWLLEEQNAELRRVLIQGLGYERLMRELEALRLDVWSGVSLSPDAAGTYREVENRYELYRITKNVDVEPIHLLKMTCPSTGHTHVGRVPPDIISAFEGARWRNWGVSPTQFAAEA